MPAPVLLAAIPALAGLLSAIGIGGAAATGATAAGATGAAPSLMGAGGLALGSELGLGGAGATAGGLGGLSAGLAPELGGEMVSAGPLEGLGNPTSAQGGLMDMDGLMGSESSPESGGNSGFDQDLINHYVNQGLMGVDMSKLYSQVPIGLMGESKYG